MLDANAFINDPNYTGVCDEAGGLVIATETGNGGPNGVFIIVDSSLRVRSGGNYPFEHRGSWPRRYPHYVKR